MTPDPRDPHQILGVRRDATRKQITAAYRRLAKRFHPDMNPADPDAEERFKEIQWAYEEVSGPHRRVYVRPGGEGANPQHDLSGPDDHPFFSFLSAVRAYYAKKK